MLHTYLQLHLSSDEIRISHLSQGLEQAVAQKHGPQKPLPKAKQNVTNAKLTKVSCDHDATKNPARPPKKACKRYCRLFDTFYFIECKQLDRLEPSLEYKCNTV